MRSGKTFFDWNDVNEKKNLCLNFNHYDFQNYIRNHDIQNKSFLFDVKINTKHDNENKIISIEE